MVRTALCTGLTAILTCLVSLTIATGLHAEPVQRQQSGLTLNGNLEKAQAWPGGPVLLITHGTLSHNRSEIISGLQSTLLDYDLSSLAINLSLAVDNRTGPYDCSIPHRHHHEDAITEISGWVAWLEKQGVTEIFPTGHSRGANQTAWFAADSEHASIPGFVLIAPQVWNAEASAREFTVKNGVSLASLLGQTSTLDGNALLPQMDFLYCTDTAVTASSLLSYYGADERKNTPMLLKSPDLKPTLLQLGSEDLMVPPELYLGSANILSPEVDIKILDGADHFFRDLFLDELVEHIVEFIDGHHAN